MIFWTLLVVRLLSLAMLVAFPCRETYWIAGTAWMPVGLLFAILSTGCDGICGSSRCTSNQASKTFSMTIAGLTNLACSNCNDYNTTFGSIPNSISCSWQLNAAGGVPTTCGQSFLPGHTVNVDIGTSGSDSTIKARLIIDLTEIPVASGGGSEVHEVAYGSIGTAPANCCIGTYGPTTVTSTVVTPGHTAQCDGTSATFTIVGSDH